MTEEFDRNFERQAFFSEAWQRRKSPTRPGGTILVDTGDLRRSVSSRTTENSIIFYTDLPYAAIHNDGGEIKVTPKMKRFFWAKYYETTGAFGRKKNGERRNDRRTVHLATEAEFFSFGTNDLTQMTFGFSRDDAGKFLPAYYDNKIYESDPFARLDQVGVGKLVDMACKLGRATRPDIHLGICGEHGGDPSSVEFCHRVGLDYVSCSPFRVPIARLAAAQAAIKDAK